MAVNEMKSSLPFTLGPFVPKRLVVSDQAWSSCLDADSTGQRGAKVEASDTYLIILEASSTAQLLLGTIGS